MKKILLNFFMIFFILACIISLTCFIKNQYELQKEKEQVQVLSELKEKEENEEQQEEKKQQIENPETNACTIEEQPKQVLDEYKKLYEENTDLIGWITIEDTIINYPVMQTVEDATFYIHKDWNKNESSMGLPFIDARCNIDSENIIIYAHNMKNGTMFGSLKNYKEQEYYKEHPIINFDTIFEKSKYQIIGVLLAKVYYEEEPKENEFIFYNYTNLNTEQKYNEYINYVKENSLYEIEENTNYGDKLITLCTCHYHTTDGRLLVVAKKIE